MIIIHAMNSLPLARAVSGTLDTMMRVMPAVVVAGARQTGKSTLARALGRSSQAGGPRQPTPHTRRYLSLDDLDVLHLARHDPDALVRGSQPVTLDEVQREPDLLSAVKREIDRERRPGRFLLTGSANLLLMRRVSESLAGRASLPVADGATRAMGLGRCGIWENLVKSPDQDWLDVVREHPTDPEDWRALARRGGFPVPSVHLDAPAERAIWFDGYVRTYLERDLQALSSIAALPDFRRLMRAAALRLGALLNQTEVGRDIGLRQPTVHRWLNLLETSYLLVRIPAYSVNRTKRLIKAPKLYWSDTGLAMHLSQEDEPRGAHLENLVLQDLLAWRDCRTRRAEVLHWRTTTGEEVEFVIEVDGSVLPIEVKATRRPRLRDAVIRVRSRRVRPDTRAGLCCTADSWMDTPGVLAAPWWGWVTSYTLAHGQAQSRTHPQRLRIASWPNTPFPHLVARIASRHSDRARPRDQESRSVPGSSLRAHRSPTVGPRPPAIELGVERRHPSRSARSAPGPSRPSPPRRGRPATCGLRSDAPKTAGWPWRRRRSGGPPKHRPRLPPALRGWPPVPPRCPRGARRRRR